ncbi:30S ribosomal protein S17 [Zea mays]|jgi:hypothetical protein|uniref:30S ribosomal protein S17 n=1 Tax=Zea mays TaxID=4577 RepID=B4FIJ4_MAIZE|nr:unknown [Zea mays]ONM04444.1 30S ribosomal protein S17 [Zea mays]
MFHQLQQRPVSPVNIIANLKRLVLLPNDPYAVTQARCSYGFFSSSVCLFGMWMPCLAMEEKIARSHHLRLI